VLVKLYGGEGVVNGDSRMRRRSPWVGGGNFAARDGAEITYGMKGGGNGGAEKREGLKSVREDAKRRTSAAKAALILQQLRHG
jgi:hypothetical protein